MADPSEGENMPYDEGMEGDDDMMFDDDFEDPKQMIREMGDHPLMERVQDALYQQLQNSHERVSLELREREEELKRVKDKREDIGVELYGVQQQLAKLQMQLENTHNNFNMLEELRNKEEQYLGEYQQKFAVQKQDTSELKSQLYKNQSELDALSATLRQVELYNEEMKSEIAVTRRATYKAEENVTGLEKEKKGQDIYIDSLNEQLKGLDEHLALYEAQMVSQKQETAAACDTLSEASKEMESISFEKKQLLQQWKSSLVGMQRRDEALQATHDALRKQKEQEVSMDAEVEGYKKSIQQEQAKNEVLMAQLEKCENEQKFTHEQLASKQAEKEKLSERYAVLQRSMNQCDSEQSKVELQCQNLQQQVNNLDQNLTVVMRERQKLEEGIAANASTQTTVSKAQKNLIKTAGQVQGQIHEKEIETSSMQNELARIRVDSLNTDAHNMQLRDTLSKLVTELKEKDSLIEKYEMEIRQRNDEIEKKMYRVDRLNRKFESLTSGMEDENTGPLEATIKNLKKEIQVAQDENTELQRNWLADQTKLVNSIAATGDVSEKNQELKSKISILQQKRLRLLQTIDRVQAEIRDLGTGISGMHTDLGKLNDLIAKNATAQEHLANGNFAMEMEFVRELKEMETESIRLEQHTSDVKLQKKAIVDEIVEAERQIMLWEKKIQLEKETQAALDPEVGQAEARSMEKEIHRMRLRLETLKRDQERMIKEMERAIYKREAISLRHRGQKKEELTQHELRKQLRALRGTIKETVGETSEYEAAVTEKVSEMETVGKDLEKASNDYGRLEEDANELQNTINDALYEKQRNLDAITKKQRMIQQYRDLEEGRFPYDVKEDGGPAHRAEMNANVDQLENVRGIINQLRVEFPHLDEVLSRVLHLAEV
jgi:chromosome segregation ATPase